MNEISNKMKWMNTATTSEEAKKRAAFWLRARQIIHWFIWKRFSLLLKLYAWLYKILCLWNQTLFKCWLDFVNSIINKNQLLNGYRKLNGIITHKHRHTHTYITVLIFEPLSIKIMWQSHNRALLEIISLNK